MTRFFHAELDTLKAHLLHMGELAATALRESIRALTERDVALALAVIEGDDRIDQLEITIDHEAMRYLTLRAPVAGDLRLLTVAIKASHDLERVGDEARNIAKRARKILLKMGAAPDLQHIPAMAATAAEMLGDALYCLVGEQVDKAYAVLAKDEEVDRLNKDNLKSYLQSAKSDPESLNRYLDLIFISKSLERIADHATNLAEEVIFLLTAKETRHQQAAQS